jgi:hypothetical protein
MTWTKLGDEFPDHARDLTDAEFRTHVEALIWSNRRGLDLHVPKHDLRRFAESSGADDAVAGLVVKRWWDERGDIWYIGLRFAEWQLERAVVEKRRGGAALRMRRSRMHKAGDHSICLPEHCDVARNETRDKTRDPGRVGSGTTYPPDPQDQDQDQSQDRSVGNSQKPRVPDGPEDASSDDQQIPIPVTHQGPATDRNARTRARSGLNGAGP